MYKIPLSVPSIAGNKWQYVKVCLDSDQVSSAGKYVDLFEEKIAKLTHAKHTIACVNGTSTLQVSLRLVGVRQGDEVLVPTLTFIAPVNAISYSGAILLFMDTDEYFNIDTEKTIEFINNETIFKNGRTYNKKTKKKYLPSWLFAYNGKFTGTVGVFGYLSFNGNKIITSGGGGMILTNNAELAKKLATLQSKLRTTQNVTYKRNRL